VPILEKLLWYLDMIKKYPNLRWLFLSLHLDISLWLYFTIGLGVDRKGNIKTLKNYTKLSVELLAS